jgi:hypothetical protein
MWNLASRFDNSEQDQMDWPGVEAVKLFAKTLEKAIKDNTRLSELYGLAGSRTRSLSVANGAY